MLNKKNHYMGLGSLVTISLAEARKQRQLLLDGINPLEYRNEAKKQKMMEELKRKTFKECAEEYIAANKQA